MATADAADGGAETAVRAEHAFSAPEVLAQFLAEMRLKAHELGATAAVLVAPKAAVAFPQARAACAVAPCAAAAAATANEPPRLLLPGAVLRRRGSGRAGRTAHTTACLCSCRRQWRLRPQQLLQAAGTSDSSSTAAARCCCAGSGSFGCARDGRRCEWRVGCSAVAAGVCVCKPHSPPAATSPHPLTLLLLCSLTHLCMHAAAARTHVCSEPEEVSTEFELLGPLIKV